MKLSEMRRLLEVHGIQLTKSLGQNFMHDGNQLRRIVAAGAVRRGDQVLEIGPGLGPLTEVLLAAGASVLAIEKDARLAAILRERLGKEPRLTIVHADAMDEVRRRRHWGGWKVVSNLPYSVASPLLVELSQGSVSAPRGAPSTAAAEEQHSANAEMKEPPLGPDLMVATVQWEVARRIIAQAGEAEYGLLTLLLRLNYLAGEHFKIPGSCFHPAPDVDSACIVLRRRDPLALRREDWAWFGTIVKRAFSQRRKMMFKLLKEDWPATVLEQTFVELGLTLGIRAEAVEFEQFIRLTQKLTASSTAHE